MRSIFKYVVRVVGGVEIPHSADVISASNQGNQVVIWAKVDRNDTGLVKRRVVGFMTGEQVGDDLNFIDTVQLPDGIVVHVFEAPKLKGV